MSLDKASIEKIDASKYKFAVVASRYNESLVDALVADVNKVFAENSVDEANVKLVRVAGANELPVVASELAKNGDYDAIIALGVVIQGDTMHHETIASSTAFAFQEIAVKRRVPIINGVIVTPDLARAQARTIGSIARGVEFAEVAIDMAHTMENL
ncbi:MAG: 6,7-dimethyl-8-ribityllumazine synthase [Opitutales bacterium]